MTAAYLAVKNFDAIVLYIENTMIHIFSERLLRLKRLLIFQKIPSRTTIRYPRVLLGLLF